MENVEYGITRIRVEKQKKIMEIEHHAHKFMPSRLGLAAASVRVAKRERGFTGILKHSRIVTTRFGHELGYFSWALRFRGLSYRTKGGAIAN